MNNDERLTLILESMGAEVISVSEYCISFSFGGNVVDIESHQRQFDHHQLDPPFLAISIDADINEK